MISHLRSKYTLSIRIFFNMNILHVCNGFTTSKLYEELINRLDIPDVIQTVIAPTFVSYKRPESLNGGINLHVIERNSSFFHRLCFSQKIRKLTSVIENLGASQYDLIHAHTLFSDGLVAYNIYRRYDIPYVVAVRNSDINFFSSFLFTNVL